MQKSWKQIAPVKVESQLFKGVMHVSVEGTVRALVAEIEANGGAQLLSRDGQISRVGMIIKQVEEATKATLTAMKTEYRPEKRQVRGQDREFNVIYFRAIFVKK